ncbi:MAG: hypothetical protein WCL51_08425 [Bacteroidota bacterium]
MKNSNNYYLRHLLTIILSLETYPQDVIDAFCQAFYNAANSQPLGSPFHALADALNLVLIPYHKAIQITDINRGEKSTDVKVIKNMKQYIIDNLSDIETKINFITHTNLNIIHELKLDIKSVFYSGSEINKRKYWEELLTNVELKTPIVSVLPQVKALTDEILGLYTNKSDDSITIRGDVTNKNVFIQPLKEQMRLCLFNTCIICNDNLSKVAEFFLTDIIDGKEKAAGYLYVNEYLLDIIHGMFQCFPQVKFVATNTFKAENLGLGDAMIFRSDTANPTSIPSYAKLIKAGETIEFPVSNIGTDTQYYLIVVAVTPGVDTQIKLTVK